MCYAYSMRTDKAKAIRYRLEGKSYTEIRKLLGKISKSTLSSWLKDVVLSSAAKELLQKRFREKSFQGLLKRNKNQTKLAIQRKEKIRAKAEKEIGKISKDNLFFIGLALYWAEGYKRPIIKNGREATYHPVSITNSDAKLIKIFLKFLIDICGVPQNRIRANLRIFKHLNEIEVLNYWIKETGILKENFTKTYLGISKSSMGKRPFNRLPFGVIQIRIGDTKLFHRIIGWIEGLKNFENLKMPG